MSTEIQGYLIGQIEKSTESFSFIAREVSEMKGQMTGLERRFDDMADLLRRDVTKTTTNVTAVGQQTDNSQTVTAGGDAVVGRDQADVKSAKLDLTIPGLIEKAKEKPLHAAGGAGLLYWASQNVEVIKGWFS